MAIDSRFIGFWVDVDGVTQIAQDPQSGDGFCYLCSQIPADYSLPDINTLSYPMGIRLWGRVESNPSGTIIGHWRHDRDSNVIDDQGEEMIFRPDNTFIDFWDGGNIYSNGTYSITQDATGMHILTSEYRSRLQTNDSTFISTRFDGIVINGSFQFGVSDTGKDTVTLTPSDPLVPPNTLTRQ